MVYLNYCVLFVWILGLNYVTAIDYDCSQPLLENAVLKATSSLRERGPENARLDGGNAWTASSSDYDQFLIVDLGYTYNITGIATRGRPHSSEYVQEYAVQYGMNGLDFSYYKEPGGEIKMFKGNIDGDTTRRNRFDVPIIAQWIRINPTRWRDRISLRLELYGCKYEAETVYFNGTALVRKNLHRDPISATRGVIRLRFKTNSPSGVLMYSRGTQGDYIALQLRDNRMLLNLDLGSGVMTSLSVGSLLDDNLWHDVVISRKLRDIIFSVDRVEIRGRVKGEFLRLDLNRELFIGGVPNKQEGLAVIQNFTGCMENVYLNSTNLISVMKGSSEYGQDQFDYKSVHTAFHCPDPPVTPVTFLTAGSYVRLKGYEGVRSLNVSFDFRTYEPDGLLMHHSFLSNGHVRLFLHEGKVKVNILTSGNPPALLDNYDERFDDGRWHFVVLTVGPNLLVLSIDGRPMKTVRLISMSTGSTYLVAGGVSGTPGFVGCMRLISVDGNYKPPKDWTADEYCCPGEVVLEGCQMIDRCNPNPCEHSGACHQNSHEFFCDCAGTGYSGAVCHTSLNPLSCTAYKNTNSVNQQAQVKIDVDGSGPLKPFPVTCNFLADGRVVTEVSHSSMHFTTVDGFQAPGSFVHNIFYDADMDQLIALVNRSKTCQQALVYQCRNSRLFNANAQTERFEPFSWWVSRNNQKMDYWAGAVPGSRKCACGIMGTCADPTKWCNCDADLRTVQTLMQQQHNQQVASGLNVGDTPGFEGWLEDSGDIAEMENLPVKQVRFGDTGGPLDDKEGRYRLGPLRCEGDDLFENVVTFRISDATINLPKFDMGHSGDIYFEFRTTVENAVIIHSRGPTDYIKVSIIGGNHLQFMYKAGGGPLGVNVETSYRLADNNWHSVSVERNRKEARIVVDGALKAEVREPPGPVRALHLTSDLVIGASVDYRDGFTGCIRALLLNGQQVDLRSYAHRGLYGVSPGCVGKCDSNPCLNNGTCHEGYDSYWCDCRWTAFKGPICADEIGVVMRSSSIIKYDFMGSWRSTIAEKIRVGFTTTNPKGFLLGFFSNITGEYLTIMVSNSGHLRVVFDFGFERQEIIFLEKHFGLGQYHDVHLSRKNSGATMVLQVDNDEPREYNFNIKASADAQFNNIQYLYIGRNESMTEGFVGCISRVEFDDIYPLKLLFQENSPPNVRSLGSPLNEDFCGVEPVTHPPDVIETRPPPIVDSDVLNRIYRHTDSAILGGVLAIIFLALVLMAVLIGRYLARHKGEYLTQEDKGADDALDPDQAVVQSATGHQVEKRKEWFI